MNVSYLALKQRIENPKRYHLSILHYVCILKRIPVTRPKEHEIPFETFLRSLSPYCQFICITKITFFLIEAVLPFYPQVTPKLRIQKFYEFLLTLTDKKTDFVAFYAHDGSLLEELLYNNIPVHQQVCSFIRHFTKILRSYVYTDFSEENLNKTFLCTVENFIIPVFAHILYGHKFQEASLLSEDIKNKTLNWIYCICEDSIPVLDPININLE